MAFLTKSWSGHAADRQQQSIKCLDCHQHALPNAKEFSPHDLPDTSLADLTRKVTPATRLTSFASVLPKQDMQSSDLTCSACHVEHQGRMHDLTKLNNERCQSCHTNRFASFTNGHPEFTDYPAHRDTRISFNHQSHSTKHFASKSKAFDCKSCHLDESQPSAVGPVGRSVSFEKACHPVTMHRCAVRSPMVFW
jgi:cytochrome c